MGPIQSKNLAKIVNETSAEIIMRSIQNCTSTTAQSQSISNNGWAIGNSQRITTTVNLSCASNFRMDTTIATQMATEIVQKAEAQQIAILDTFKRSKSENIMDISNRISNNITNELIQSTFQALTQSQEIKNNYVAIGNSQQIDSTTVQTALAESIGKTNLSNSIETQSSQSAKTSSTNPLAFLADYMWIVLLVFVVIISGVVGIIWAIAN